jgi:XTP/dITP diphosphohydrolase
MSRRFGGGTLVLATHNDGKLREFASMLAPLGVETVSAASLGLPEPAETEATFAGNARQKAHAATRGGLPALADDSGIEVEALGGAPGVHTADWAQTPEGRDYLMAMTRVWSELDTRAAGHPRRARFCATLCLAWPDGHDELFEGQVDGTLRWPPSGELGFGFDPIFVPDGHDVTFGDMDPALKRRISHRAIALGKLLDACFA